MSSKNDKFNLNGKKALQPLPRAPSLPSKPAVKAQPSSHGASSQVSGWAAIAAGRPKDETTKQGVSPTLRTKRAHPPSQHQSPQQVESQKVQYAQQEQHSQPQAQIVPFKLRESVNGFNSDEVEQFLKVRSTSYRDTPVYKESGSEWSKPTGSSRSKKEKDVVMVQLSKIIKHYST